MRYFQQELERIRRQLVQQVKKFKEYGVFVFEMKEFRDFNRRFQDVLFLRFGSGECFRRLFIISYGRDVLFSFFFRRVRGRGGLSVFEVREGQGVGLEVISRQSYFFLLGSREQLIKVVVLVIQNIVGDIEKCGQGIRVDSVYYYLFVYVFSKRQCQGLWESFLGRFQDSKENQI